MEKQYLLMASIPIDGKYTDCYLSITPNYNYTFKPLKTHGVKTVCINGPLKNVKEYAYKNHVKFLNILKYLDAKDLKLFIVKLTPDICGEIDLKY